MNNTVEITVKKTEKKKAGSTGAQVTTPSDREIAITSVFDAPRNLVFDAHTKPELIKRWLGVRAGWTLAVCEVDLRVGGKYRYVWRKQDGFEMGMGGVFREIVAPQRLVTNEAFDQKWYEGECRVTTELTERGGKTTLTMTLRYDSKQIRDNVLKSPMKDGLDESFDALAKLLATQEGK